MADVNITGVGGTLELVSTSVSSSPSAVDRVMAIPHIVTSIIQYARQDRTSLARLMRMNKNFYLEAAPLLYHTVAIWEETVDSFFLGSFTPCKCEECVTELKEKWGIDHENNCLTEYGKLFNQPHGYGKYTNPAPRPEPATPTKATSSGDTPGASPSKSSPASTPGPVTPKDEKDATLAGNSKAKKKSKNSKKSKSKKAKKTKATKVTRGGEPAEGCGDNYNVDMDSDEDSDDELSGIRLPISKQDLLRRVRVLTLGSHHESACGIHCDQVIKFMQNVEVLRIVETPCAPHRTFHICENVPGGSCPMIDALNPRKIVVRNVSGLAVPFPVGWKASDKTKELVFVLPTKLISYTGKKGCPSEELLKSFLGQFNEVDVIRVVFWPEWDDSLTHHPLARKLGNDDESRRIQAALKDKPLPVDYMAQLMHALTKTRRVDPFEWRRPSVDFYGFGQTVLSVYGNSQLVAEHKKAFGDDASYNLHTLAKHRAMRKEIGMAVSAGGGGFVLGSCDEVTWYTLANYKRKRFQAEITEWD